MGKLLDRLAEWLWLPWAICIGWAALVMFSPAGFDLIELLIGISLLAVWLIALVGKEIIKAEAAQGPAIDFSEFRTTRDPLLTVLMCLSLAMTVAMIVADWILDLEAHASVPLMFSVFVPLSLRSRSDMKRFIAARQAAA